MPKAIDRAVRFFLEKPNATAPTYVHLIFNEGQRFKYYTRCVVTPKNWDRSTFRVIKGVPGAKAVNDQLENIEQYFSKELKYYDGQGIAPNYAAIRLVLDEKVKEKEKPKPLPTVADTSKLLVPFIETFIANEQKTKSFNTLKQYGTSLNHIKSYLDSTGVKSLAFDDVTTGFYKSFRTFLHDELDLYDNSVGTTIKNLKVFMGVAAKKADDRLALHQNFEFKEFETPTEDADTVYLKPNEIDRYWKLKIDTAPKNYSVDGLRLVRDGFVSQCYLGMRYSDLRELKDEHLDKENGIVKVRTQKTGELVAVPLHDYVLETIERHSEPIKYRNRRQDEPGVLIPVFANQKYNNIIKIISQMAGFTELVEVTRTKWNVQKFKSALPKYELIASHTARRSFATNLYLQGFPVISIMAITGHTTEKAFMKYIRVTKEEHAMKLKAFWKTSPQLFTIEKAVA